MQNNPVESIAIVELSSKKWRELEDSRLRSLLSSERGVATIPGLLTPEALAQSAHEARQKADAAFVAISKHNVFLSEDDDRLGQDHVKNWLVDTVVASIAFDELDENGSFEEILFW